MWKSFRKSLLLLLYSEDKLTYLSTESFRQQTEGCHKIHIYFNKLISTFSSLCFSYISFSPFHFLILLSLRLHYLAENKDDFPCSLVLLKKDQKSHSKVIGHSRLNKVLGKPRAAFLTCGQYVQMRNNEDDRFCT